jgi:hypothetical protein
MFTGWREQGHAVRPIYELSNFLQTGQIRIHMREPIVPKPRTMCFRTWRKNTFSKDDLIDYIENDLVHNGLIKALVPYEDGIQVKGKRLIVQSSRLDAIKLLEEHEKPIAHEIEEGE